MSTELIPSMKATLFSPVTSDLGGPLLDIAEAGLDSILEAGVLKNIPILGTIAGFCKAGASIREKNLIRQTAVFITSFNNGSISDDELSGYRTKLENDNKRAERELGRVILLLDRIIEEIQSKMLGAFYRSYVKGGIGWDKFCELSEANERMFVSDYVMLEAICRNPIKQDVEITDKKMYRIQRLESLGLVMENRTRLHSGNILSYPDTDDRFVSTPLGGTFFSLMRAGGAKEGKDDA